MWLLAGVGNQPLGKYIAGPGPNLDIGENSCEVEKTFTLAEKKLSHFCFQVFVLVSLDGTSSGAVMLAALVGALVVQAT